MPDERGYFGAYGGRFVPETVIQALRGLESAYSRAKSDRGFKRRFLDLLAEYSGRPTPLMKAANLMRSWGGASVYLKREDLNHTGSHKLNNCLGQALLAKECGKTRVIAETGAGQHGVASATACALMRLECVVYMGARDMERQSTNVEKMEVLGAEVRGVDSGTATLKDAINEAMRDWAASHDSTHYMIGSVVGPHPYPAMVRDFQSVIGFETRRQIAAIEGRLPSAVVACVGGGSNAMGMFHAFLARPGVRLVGVEAFGGGTGPGMHAATLSFGSPGVLHGASTYLLHDAWGQVTGTHSISAGLDYPGVGPEHSCLKDLGRVEYTGATDAEAVAAFRELAALEGIIPALESSHALAHARRVAAEAGAGGIVVVNLSGRGDKDLGIVRDFAEESFLKECGHGCLHS